MTAELDRLAEDYWDAYLAGDPMQGTVLGDHRYGGRLGDISPAGQAALGARFFERAEQGAQARAAGVIHPAHIGHQPVMPFGDDLVERFDELRRGQRVQAARDGGHRHVTMMVKRNLHVISPLVLIVGFEPFGQGQAGKFSSFAERRVSNICVMSERLAYERAWPATTSS